MLIKLSNLPKTFWGDSEWLFPSFQGKKVTTRHMTYDYARRIFKNLLFQFNLPSNLSLHSLMSGGATAAAAAGVLKRHIQHHGRWKSAVSIDGYISTTQQQQLRVTSDLI